MPGCHVSIISVSSAHCTKQRLYQLQTIHLSTHAPLTVVLMHSRRDLQNPPGRKICNCYYFDNNRNDTNSKVIVILVILAILVITITILIIRIIITIIVIIVIVVSQNKGTPI